MGHTQPHSHQQLPFPNLPNQPNPPSTCLLPTPTSPMRASSVRSATPFPTPPPTSPRPSRAAPLRLPRRPTSSRLRATSPAKTRSPTASLVLSALPATRLTRASTRVLPRPTSAPSKLLISLPFGRLHIGLTTLQCTMALDAVR